MGVVEGMQFKLMRDPGKGFLPEDTFAIAVGKPKPLRTRVKLEGFAADAVPRDGLYVEETPSKAPQ